MDKVFITDLVGRGVIGIQDWEREKPQEIVMNFTIFTSLKKAGLSDNINDTVNYRTIAKLALAHAESVGRQTVEALAHDLAQICLNQPGVEKVIVRVEKPGAVRFSKSVGVEIERSRKDFE